jgi:hypothetical protein
VRGVVIIIVRLRVHDRAARAGRRRHIEGAGNSHDSLKVKNAMLIVSESLHGTCVLLIANLKKGL